MTDAIQRFMKTHLDATALIKIIIVKRLLNNNFHLVSNPYTKERFVLK